MGLGAGFNSLVGIRSVQRPSSLRGGGSRKLFQFPGRNSVCSERTRPSATVPTSAFQFPGRNSVCSEEEAPLSVRICSSVFQFPGRNSVCSEPYLAGRDTARMAEVSIPWSEFGLFRGSPPCAPSSACSRFQFPGRNSVCSESPLPDHVLGNLRRFNSLVGIRSVQSQGGAQGPCPSGSVSIPWSEFGLFRASTRTKPRIVQAAFQFPGRNSVCSEVLSNQARR